MTNRTQANRIPDFQNKGRKLDPKCTSTLFGVTHCLFVKIWASSLLGWFTFWPRLYISQPASDICRVSGILKALLCVTAKVEKQQRSLWPWGNLSSGHLSWAWQWTGFCIDLKLPLNVPFRDYLGERREGQKRIMGVEYDQSTFIYL